MGIVPASVCTSDNMSKNVKLHETVYTCELSGVVVLWLSFSSSIFFHMLPKTDVDCYHHVYVCSSVNFKFVCVLYSLGWNFRCTLIASISRLEMLENLIGHAWNFEAQNDTFWKLPRLRSSALYFQQIRTTLHMHHVYLNI